MEQLTKSKERIKEYGEVYTPEWLVKDMCNMLTDEGNAFTRIDETFLEPSCGSGNFLVEILDRKLKLCKDYNDGLTALSTIWGIDILPDNVAESKERMLNIYKRYYSDGVEKATEILDKNIICGDSLKIMDDWYKEELMNDIICLAECLLNNVKIKDKPDKNGKVVSVIEIHDDVPVTEYLKSAIEKAKKKDIDYA